MSKFYKKIKTLLLLSTSALVAINICPSAQVGASGSSSPHKYYIKADVLGLVNMSDASTAHSMYRGGQLDGGTHHSVGAGMHITDKMRADLNLGYLRANFTNTVSNKEEEEESATLVRLSQKIKFITVTAQGYYDIDIGHTLTPYLSAGLGCSRNVSKKMRTSVVRERDTRDKLKKRNQIVWNVGLGAKTKLSNNLYLDLSYKYGLLGSVNLKNTDVKYKTFYPKTHIVSLGGVYYL